VSREYQFFLTSPPPSPPHNDPSNSLEEKRKRLLYLFVKDLSPGLSGEVMISKQERDATLSSMRFNRIPWKWKFLSWIFVILINMAMLFYVYVFALRQSKARQAAWFQSFVIWLIFEIVISSTGLVFLFHLLIPLFVLSDVAKVKLKVWKDLMKYRNRYTTQQPPPGKELGMLVTSTNGQQQQQQPEPKHRQQQHLRQQEERPAQPSAEFNAAKYFYTSWRVASLTRSSEHSEKIPESEFILTFTTPWPKKKFGSEETEVSSEYDQDILMSAVSRIALFFLTALVQCHVLLQDIVMQVVWSGGFGYLGVVSIRLYHLHPYLPAVVLVGLGLCVSLLMRSLGSKSDLVRAMEEIHPVTPLDASSPTAVAISPSSVPLNLPEPSNSIAPHPPIPSPQPMPMALLAVHPLSLPPTDLLSPQEGEEEEEKEMAYESPQANDSSVSLSSTSYADLFSISDEENEDSDSSSSISASGDSSSSPSSSSLESFEIKIVVRPLDDADTPLQLISAPTDSQETLDTLEDRP
jgi:hypothetical protein